MKIFIYIILIGLISSSVLANDNSITWKVILINGSSYITETEPILKNRSYQINVKEKKLLLQEALVAKIIKIEPKKQMVPKKENSKNQEVFVLNDDILKKEKNIIKSSNNSNISSNNILKIIDFKVDNTYRQTASSKQWSSGTLEFTLKNKSNNPMKFLKLKFIWYKSGGGERIKENYQYAVREVPLNPKGYYKGKDTCFYNLSDASSISYTVDVYGTTDGNEYLPIKKKIFVYSGAVDNLKEMQAAKDKIYKKIDDIDRKINELEEKIDKLESKKKEYQYVRGYDWKIDNANRDIEKYKEQITKYEKEKEDLRDELRKVVH